MAAVGNVTIYPNAIPSKGLLYYYDTTYRPLMMFFCLIFLNTHTSRDP